MFRRARSYAVVPAALLLLGLGGACGSNPDPKPGCDEIPCFRANECVESCGGPLVYTGCCACPTASFDRVLMCGVDAGDGGGTDAVVADAGGSDAMSDAGDASQPADAAALLGYGELCSDGSECVSGTCETFITVETRCTGSCAVGMKACPPDGVCYVPGAASGWCTATCDPALNDCPMGLTCSSTGFAPPQDYGCI